MLREGLVQHDFQTSGLLILLRLGCSYLRTQLFTAEPKGAGTYIVIKRRSNCPIQISNPELTSLTGAEQPRQNQERYRIQLAIFNFEGRQL